MRRIIVVWFVFLMLMGGALGVVNPSTDAEELGNGDAKTRSASQSKSGLPSHDPIYIDGNDDFISQASTESWTGDGSAASPYIITNYDINASQGTDSGIYIKNTTVYFIIRNCTIHDGYDLNNYIYNNGIYFWNVTNGKIENCETYNNYNSGIELCAYSNNNTITANQVYNNSYYGISLFYSSNNIISSNHVYNHSGNGIWLCDSPNNNTITLNHVYKNVRGIDVTSSSNNTMTLNQIYDNSYGICLLSSSNNNIITSNHIYNNSYGIWLKKSSNNEIHYNNIYNNTNYGVNNYNSESQYVANATNNWWGSSDGPGVGGANPVSSNVVYDPWLTEPWTVEAENQPPTVSITSPSSGSTVSATITISGTSSDPDGTIQSVEASIDDNTFATNKLTVSGTTSWSASWDTTQYTDDSHTVYVRAYDGTDYSTVKSVTVTVSQTYVNQAPTVAISSPSNDETVKGTITVSGIASDPDGVVSVVQIRIGTSGSWVTVSGTTSWSYSWNTTKVSDGPHIISVRSFDGTDYSSLASVSVNVRNEEEKPFEIPWLYIIMLVIIIIVLAGVVLGIKRKRRKTSPPPRSPSQQSP